MVRGSVPISVVVVTLGVDVVSQEAVAGAQNETIAGRRPDLGLAAEEHQKASLRRRVQILGRGGFE